MCPSWPVGRVVLCVPLMAGGQGSAVCAPRWTVLYVPPGGQCCRWRVLHVPHCGQCSGWRVLHVPHGGQYSGWRVLHGGQCSG